MEKNNNKELAKNKLLHNQKENLNEKNSLIYISYKNLNILHILLIILEALFIILPCFHINLWFDESYSVAISRHSFQEIWQIGSKDVHPVLYYIIIKIVGFFTNGSIIWIRIFSAIPLIIMSIIGYTHIKKDFGNKVGILFSFFSCMLSPCLIYASEIRMYTWAMLFVLLMFIYTYRILNSKNISTKNWILFTFFSLCSEYIHYYGLAAAFIVNLIIFIILGIRAYKSKNIKGNIYIKNLKRWFISAITQLICYIPWLDAVMLQVKGLGNGFWIPAPTFKTILEIMEFQFIGNLGDKIYVPKFLSIPFTAFFSIYLIYLLKKNWNKDEIKPIWLAILIYFLVVLFIGLISIIKPLLYPRYFMTITGLFIFAVCILLAREKIGRIMVVCIITLVMSLVTNINLINENYDKSNDIPLAFILNKKNENDIFLISNDISGFQLPLELNVSSENIYFYDKDNWGIEEAYKAFGNTIHKLSELNDFKGNVWTISSSNDLSNEFLENVKNTRLEAREYFETKYKNYKYVISMIERK